MVYQPSPDPTAPKPRTRLGLKIALVSAGLAAGAIGATAIASNAQSSTTTGAPSGYATGTTVPDGGASGVPARDHNGAGPARDHDGAGPARDDEKSVGTAQAATLRAAALKAVPGGRVDRIETDSGDAVYEAHMTKADGTKVTVKFDKNLTISGVEAGMGK